MAAEKYSIFRQLNHSEKEQLSTVLNKKHSFCFATTEPEKSLQKKTRIGIPMRNCEHRTPNWEYSPQQPHPLQQPKSAREIHPVTARRI